MTASVTVRFSKDGTVAKEVEYTSVTISSSRVT